MYGATVNSQNKYACIYSINVSLHEYYNKKK